MREGPKGLAAGMSCEAEPANLTDRLGARWTVLETSFIYHASCRHTHPAADALQKTMQENGLSADDISSVVAQVHQGAIDVLGPVVNPTTVHQSKFSMGTVLGLLALRGRAGLPDLDAALGDTVVEHFRDRVRMALATGIDKPNTGQRK